MKSSVIAQKLARQAYESALMEYEDLDDYKSYHCGLVMQQLRDNLKIWSLDEGGEENLDHKSVKSDEEDQIA